MLTKAMLVEKWKYTDDELVALIKSTKNPDDWDFDELKSFICLNCLECCHWLSIQTNMKDIHPQMESYKFHVEARGMLVTKLKGRGIFFSMQHDCPHFVSEKGCSIYEKRPLSCRHYDGRMDFLMKDVCRWNILELVFKEDADESSD